MELFCASHMNESIESFGQQAKNHCALCHDIIVITLTNHRNNEITQTRDKWCVLELYTHIEKKRRNICFHIFQAINEKCLLRFHMTYWVFTNVHSCCVVYFSCGLSAFFPYHQLNIIFESKCYIIRMFHTQNELCNCFVRPNARSFAFNVMAFSHKWRIISSQNLISSNINYQTGHFLNKPIYLRWNIKHKLQTLDWIRCFYRPKHFTTVHHVLRSMIYSFNDSEDLNFWYIEGKSLQITMLPANS